MRARPPVLVTRAAGQASGLAERLRELDLEPVVVPVIEVAEPESFAGLDAAVGRLGEFDWLVFSSANGVEAFARRVEALGVDVRSGGRTPKVAAVGAMTARAVERVLGLGVDVVPEKAVAESLAETLAGRARREDGSPGRFLVVRAEKGREVVGHALRAAGAEVVEAVGYRTVVPAGAAERVREIFAEGAEGVDAVVFTSSSSVTNFFGLMGAAGVRLPAGVAVVSIGPVTSATVREYGRNVDLEASGADVFLLAKEVAFYLCSK